MNRTSKNIGLSPEDDSSKTIRRSMIAHRVLLFQLKGLQDALPRDGLLAIVSLLATERKQISLSVDDPHVKLVHSHNVQRRSLRIDQPATHVTGPLDALVRCHLNL